jgi:hypothetical protein
MLMTQAGCGTESESQGPAQLPDSQLRQIERLYRVQIDAEKIIEQGEGRRAVKETSKACAAVDESDPLLAAVVNGCGELTQLALSLSDPKCDSAPSCARFFRLTAIDADELVKKLRQSERTITDLLDGDSCADALVAPRDFVVTFETMGGALREMGTAIETGNDARGRDAAKKLETAVRDLEATPSARELLDRFREACA